MTLAEGLKHGLRMKNTSRVYANGKTFPTNNCGSLTIQGQINFKENNVYDYFKVQFEDGTSTIANRRAIWSGGVQNKYQRTMYNKGYIGEGKFTTSVKGKLTKEAQIWIAILYRCYDPKAHKKFPTYVDCELSEDWCNFQVFCEDLPKLTNYNKWRQYQQAYPKERNVYELDKDTKVQGNKVYGINTCCFITRTENVVHAHLTGKTYIAHRLSDGYEEEFVNMAAFIREKGFKTNKITDIIKGKGRAHKGWVFRVKEDEDVS